MLCAGARPITGGWNRPPACSKFVRTFSIRRSPDYVYVSIIRAMIQIHHVLTRRNGLTSHTVIPLLWDGKKIRGKPVANRVRIHRTSHGRIQTGASPLSRCTRSVNGLYDFRVLCHDPGLLRRICRGIDVGAIVTVTWADAGFLLGT